MAKQVEIRIIEIVGGGLCLASADGQKVYDAVAAALRAGRSVQLSFKGVEDLTSAFLNTAIGQLYSEFPEDEIRAKLSVVDASQDDLFLLKRVVDRAKEFFKNPQRFRAAVRQALGEEDEP